MKYIYESPIGGILLVCNEDALMGLYFQNEILQEEIEHDEMGSGEILRKTILQLDEYFAGKRKKFEIPLKLAGTEFQQKVWEELQNIPYGVTQSYGDIAKSIGNPKAVRAVGGANHRNPVSIIVPCHRVIGSNGKLTGYGGELWRKEWLLQHEKRLESNV